LNDLINQPILYCTNLYNLIGSLYQFLPILWIKVFALILSLQFGNLFQNNEALRSKLRGIKAELRRSRTRLRSEELRRGSPCLSSLQQAAGYSGEGE
jgi:hypothetical protein